MCDYSLHAVASRPAKVGDHLVTTRFPDTSTRGFAAVGEPTVAVCLTAGTEIAFESAPRRNVLIDWLQHFGHHDLVGKVARFRQVNIRKNGTHHDAVEFASGKVVLVTRLRVGQRATVLQLPTQPETLGKLSQRLPSERESLSPAYANE